MRWIENELAGLNLGDRRLDKRGILIAKDLANGMGKATPECFKTRADLVAAYRFFDNRIISEKKILEPHFQMTRERLSKRKTVLCPSDSSSIDYTDKASVKGLGILESKNRQGLFIHPTLAISPERECLGLIDVHMWTRGSEPKRAGLSSHARGQEIIENKESFRWLQSHRRVNELARQFPQTQFVSMHDREGDILELLEEATREKKEGGADIIVRLRHDRTLLLQDCDETSEKKLKQRLRNASVIGHTEFTLSVRDKKPKRQVIQTLRACSVTLNGKRVGERKYPPVEINVICAIEENPPPGEKAVCWMFFTTLPIGTEEEVLTVIQYYLCRWEIEIFFKILKSGCQVEERELKDVQGLRTMIAFLLIVAWVTHYVSSTARQYPDIACTEVFEDSEWKAVYKILNKGKKLPRKVPTLGELVLMIAVLGGYVKTKNRPPPGPTVIWRGLRRTFDFALAWDNF